MIRIGIFGGTFNPVHLGHLRAALEVREGFRLDQVFLIPAALPPHKPSGEIAAADDRLAMIDLAIAGNSGLKVSEVELGRAGPSYTIDTIQHFYRTLPRDSRIFLVMGLDAFLEIDSWKSYEELLTTVPFIVINRPGQTPTDAGDARAAVERYLHAKVSEAYRFVKSESGYTAPGRATIYIHRVTSMEISATRIRALIRQGRSIEYLVPSKVLKFIHQKGLYR
jgi:nicotinate-nucleotide adenylyltransferase